MSVRYCMPGQEILDDGGVGPVAGGGEVGAGAGDGEDPAAGGGHPRADAGAEDLDAGKGPGRLQAVDGVAGAGGGGVALGGQDDRHRGIVDERRLRREAAGGGLGQQLGQVAVEPGEDDLGLGVAEADVVLEHLEPVGGEHEAGVEDAPVVDAPEVERVQGGFHRPLDDLLHQVLPDAGHGGEGAHAARVRTRVAVAQPLVVLGRRQRHRPPPVADAQQRDLGADQALFDDHPPAGGPEGVARQLGGHVGDGLVERIGDQHALARSQAVGLDHVGRGQRAEEDGGRRARRRTRRGGRSAPGRRPGSTSSTPSSPPGGRRRLPDRTPAGRRPAAGRPTRRPTAPRGRSRTGRRRSPPEASTRSRVSRGCRA